MSGRNCKRQRGFAGFLALCAALLVAGSTAAWSQVSADPPGRVGRIAARQGDVWILDADSSEWVAAALNRPFTQGDRLATGADGSATLRIGSTALIMDRDTTIDAVRLDDDRVQIALEQGSVALQVLSADIAAETALSTAEGRFEPLRAGLYRVDRQGQTSWGSVWRGELALTAPDLRLTLQPGERADLWLDTNRGLTHSRPLAPLNDDFAATVWRDTESAAGAGAAAPVYVSPEMTGADDLGRYGGWQQHPQFGPVWAPTVVAAGWAPYRFGQWVWLRPWGWTWVDDAPWGFAPFHFGRWFWWGGRWFWAPGPWMPRPVFAPALVGWFGGPQLRVVIGAQPSPAVGWVPLAPHERYRPPFAAGPAYLNRVNAGPPGFGGRPPGYANRQVPGAVTVLPGAAPVPRQPVAGMAVDGRVVDWRRRLPRDDFYRPPPPALPAAPQATSREPVQWPAHRPVPPAMPPMPARPVTQPPLPQVPVQPLPPPRPHPGP
ncbi:MAG TPA: hypothetical protein P5305_01820, partial [Rubrivivax sp.]|nr:hypothetical protein [Rubrivivax sp.]